MTYFVTRITSDFQTDVDGNFQSMDDPSYQDYRAEAQMHFELRSECIKKAALAYNKRQGELAKIYADQVRCLVVIGMCRESVFSSSEKGGAVLMYWWVPLNDFHVELRGDQPQM